MTLSNLIFFLKPVIILTYSTMASQREENAWQIIRNWQILFGMSRNTLLRSLKQIAYELLVLERKNEGLLNEILGL